MDSFSIKPITPDQAGCLAPLTWASYRPLLSWDLSQQRETQACFLAAWDRDQPVGLVLSLCPRPRSRSLLSLMVTPSRRRRGIGLDLLRAVTQDAGGTVAQTQFSDRLPGAAVFSHLLLRGGWSPPVPVSHRICGPVHKTFAVFRSRSGIIGRLRRQGFTLPSWESVSHTALPAIIAMIQSGAAPAWADPRPWLSRLHPQASLVITDGGGDLCGWVVCQHQAELDRWYFPIGWVRQPQAGNGWLLGAYAEGAARLSDAHGPGTRVVVESGAGQHDMVRVLDRHFTPHADWADRMMESSFTPLG